MDSTEIDMRLGDCILEAKLTESDFTSASKAHVRRYANFADVFDDDQLPQEESVFQGYQLIRNVLAAAEQGRRFIVACDARRPDLLHEWWLVHGAIRSAELRQRCGFVLWQEIIDRTPRKLRVVLRAKYGLA